MPEAPGPRDFASACAISKRRLGTHTQSEQMGEQTMAYQRKGYRVRHIRRTRVKGYTRTTYVKGHKYTRRKG